MQEVRDGKIVSFTGDQILSRARQARDAAISLGLRNEDRCVLLARNGVQWIAADLALMSEGVIVVPMYVRQAPAELAAMMKDAAPAHVLCSDSGLGMQVRKHWPEMPQVTLLEDLFFDGATGDSRLRHHADSDAVTIIYTSGTSGEPKGVVLNAGNVGHMIPSTNARLDQLMGDRSSGRPDRIFHYGPFCFAASWILLLTALSRNSVLTLSTDLSKLSEELKVAEPDYFINVPIFLERVRRTIEEAIQKRGSLASAVFARARRAYSTPKGTRRLTDALCLLLANRLMFQEIRKGVGANLKALICGSAPLSPETQLFFTMLGIPVLQVYGLTETTAICTLDDPHSVEPGHVGHAIAGTEMMTAENGEILVRGPHIFPGYWRRPSETAKALDGGWFHTGDLGEVNANGNWRITGRVKDLIILSSGHNVAPEPLERELKVRLPQAQQVVVVGNQRSFLSMLVATGPRNGLTPAAIQGAVETMNSELPHYKQIRAFQVVEEPFTPENGLMTTMGKIKRDTIAARYASEIDGMYRKKPA